MKMKREKKREMSPTWAGPTRGKQPQPIQPNRHATLRPVVFLLTRTYVTPFMPVYLPSPSMAIHASNHFFPTRNFLPTHQ